MRKISFLGWCGIILLIGLIYLVVKACIDQGVSQTLIVIGVALVVLVGATLFYKFVFND